MSEPKFPNVYVQLVGQSGDTGQIMARVCRALRDSLSDDACEDEREEIGEAIRQFRLAVFSCDSYQAVLRLVMDTVSVGSPEDYE